MSAEEFRGYYPGSKQELPPRYVEPAKPVKDDDSWDSHPIIKRVGGEPKEFFTLGALCKVFNRPPVTIRLWIKHDKIPEARFRMPANGASRGGRRLYTRPQIEVLIKIAAQRGLLNAPRITWENHRTFASDVRAAWDTLD